MGAPLLQQQRQQQQQYAVHPAEGAGSSYFAMPGAWPGALWGNGGCGGYGWTPTVPPLDQAVYQAPDGSWYEGSRAPACGPPIRGLAVEAVTAFHLRVHGSLQAHRHALKDHGSGRAVLTSTEPIFLDTATPREQRLLLLNEDLGTWQTCAMPKHNTSIASTVPDDDDGSGMVCRPLDEYEGFLLQTGQVLLHLYLQACSCRVADLAQPTLRPAKLLHLLLEREASQQSR